jgi:hypothetical protein
LGFTAGPIFGGLLYQLNPILPYAFAAAVYAILFLFMGRLSQKMNTKGTIGES